jgi:hypothetical protein
MSKPIPKLVKRSVVSIVTPPSRMSFPTLVDPREQRDEDILRIQAANHAAECGVFQAVGEGFVLSPKVLARAAKAAYERFVKELGMQNDARVKDWENLANVHKQRWGLVVRAVFESAGFGSNIPAGEGARGSAGSIPRATSGRVVRSDDAPPAKKVSKDRGRGARRR